MTEIALSIRQPWAWAILYAGKDIENRTWSTRFRGRILIHASKKPDNCGDEWINFIHSSAISLGMNAKDIPAARNLGFGGIVGEAEIVDCVTDYESLWFGGPYGFVLKNTKPLPFQPYKGALGFFKVQQ